MIVAIDGPAGSGKSTTAREVARRLGWLYMDTGAMYRAAALAFLEADVPFEDDRVAEALDARRIDLRPTDAGLRVFLGDQDVTATIREPRVSEASSRISALPAIRNLLVEEQRRIAGRWREHGGVVIEGRDIGTVVFPDAEVKFFLIADPLERARRRHRELLAAGRPADLAEVAAEIRDRDERDAGRALSPLMKAEDAIELDSTALSLEDQIEQVLEFIETRRNGLHG